MGSLSYRPGLKWSPRDLWKHTLVSEIPCGKEPKVRVREAKSKGGGGFGSRPGQLCSDTQLPQKQAVLNMKTVCSRRTWRPFKGAFPGLHIVWGKFPLWRVTASPERLPWGKRSEWIVNISWETSTGRSLDIIWSVPFMVNEEQFQRTVQSKHVGWISR